MNNPGLYASIYQLIGEYAELVDTVLINLKSDTCPINDPSRQKLGNLLIALSGNTWDSLPIRMIALLLREKQVTNHNKWAKLGESLLAGQVDIIGIKDLEDIAKALENEQISAMTKMRGSLR
ncbi:MAG: hypothetical protein ROW48_10505 [Bellilinea sp.]|jgi:hypothetical protein